MISQGNLRRALNLPVDGTDREITTAMAAQAGFSPPTEDVTIRYLMAVLEAVPLGIASESPEHRWEGSEAALIIVHEKPLMPFYENDDEYKVIVSDLAIPRGDLVTAVHQYIGNMIPKIGRASLIKVIPQEAND